MKVIDKISQEGKNFLYEREARHAEIQQKVLYSVPYVCQFARPEHAELSLKKELAPIHDPHWKETGAESPERYAEWAFTMCGMASAAMALEYFSHKRIPPAELAEDALKSGVYAVEKDGLSGMKYQEFATWIRKHRLQATVYSKLSIKGIEYALSKGKLVIVSVNPNIRGHNTAPTEQKGGHLVLVNGYDLGDNSITINNPSGFVSMDTQINHTLPVEDFKSFYAGRGIVISPEA
jgi:hypothetical protein